MSTSETRVFIDGKELQGKKLSLSLLDVDRITIFESMLAFGDVIFRLEDHLKRLYQSAKTVGIKVPKEEAAIREELLSTLRQCHRKEQRTFVRLTVAGDHLMISLTSRSWPDYIYRRGVDLVTTPVRRNFSNACPPEAKTGQFLNAMTASVTPFPKETFELLFFDREGYVKEARTWNFFLVRRNIVRTPETFGILDGVTRRFVIECALKERFPVEEKAMTRHDIWNADEAFLTNTSGGIVPVRSLDGRLIGNQVPGSMTQRLTKRYQEELIREIKNAPHLYPLPVGEREG